MRLLGEAKVMPLYFKEFNVIKKKIQNLIIRELKN